jgi:hypothetical protein
MFRTIVAQRSDGTWQATYWWTNREGKASRGGFLSRVDAIRERCQLYLQYGSEKQKQAARDGLERLDRVNPPR